ncbi:MULTISPECIES: LacI family DNA-binding transcriptional regulator [Tessaracoccus]|uniref:LacI family DNA-binding transcriptional regulator n=1 Tax=Tessaracoccus TaxID=72763 RepID=UPI0009C3DDDB|nr:MULTISPECIES: substrate-binding domain-containing protein [Tessaracoccus]AQX17020.1 hypothetical protein BKM78_14660 [Tessaracoccus sp. T2.5-30]
MERTQPNRAAVGLVLRRSVRALGIEEFYTEFMGGVEEALATHETPLILQVVPDLASELDAYRRWSEGQRVVGVILVDLLALDDPRLELVSELAIHCVMLTPDPAPSAGAAVVVDEASPMLEVVRHLADLGHTNIGRVSGPSEFVHTVRRSEAFASACETVGVRGVVAEGDYTPEAGRAAVEVLLCADPAPTALVFDNDVMAVAAIAYLRERGLAVPEGMSVIAWDDSAACRLATPPLAALRRDVRGLGEQVATALLDSIESGRPATYAAETPHLVVRASTGIPRG